MIERMGKLLDDERDKVKQLEQKVQELEKLQHWVDTLSQERTTLQAALAQHATLQGELVKALQTAKRTIKAWHNMRKIGPKEWELYQGSPEMQTINRVLAKVEAPAPAAGSEEAANGGTGIR